MKKQRRKQDFLQTFFFSQPAILLSLLLIAVVLYWPSLTNYFVGDDFTWLRWASDCQKGACQPFIQLIGSYFTQAGGFFYRPGTKLYFYFLYHLFSYNPVAYHIGSLSIHILNSFMVFLLAQKILRNRVAACITALLFLTLNVHSETISWISSINHLGASFFVLLGLLTFLLWRETQKNIFLFISLLSVLCAPLFHELGIVAPLLIIGYDLVWNFKDVRKKGLSWYYFVYALQIPLYLFLRFVAQSHWLSGDYNYSLRNLPFNLFGNTIGYIGLILGGSKFLPLYTAIRVNARAHIAVTIILILVVIGILLTIGLLTKKLLSIKPARNYLLAFVLFIIPLLPFLGLGNITYRYTYLASFGLMLFLVQLGFSFLTFLPKKYHVFGVITLVILTLTFSYYNIYELERLAGDWQKAGTITKEFAKGVKQEKSHNPTIYVVNPPIRYHEAWVFPVGIEDAYWLGSRHNSEIIRVSQKDADNIRKSSQNVEVFVFEDNGAVRKLSND